MESRTRSPFYFLLALAMSCTVFTGFSFTYFGPLFGGGYPRVSPLVHVHGWTFFAWYMLLPIQAGMVRSGKAATHRTLGLASVVLGVLMIGVGFLLSVVQIDMARGPDGNPFWQLLGVPIFWIWVLFTLFYVEAIRRRRRVDQHRRLIVLASAVALSAATYRIVARVLGFGTWVAVAGTLACVLFPLAAMIHDRLRRGTIHPVYRWGVPAIVLTIGGAFLVGPTPGGDVMERGLAWIGRALRPLY